MLELSLANWSVKFLFSDGALDLHPAGVGVEGLMVTMVFTCSSTWEISTLELLRFSLEAAVDNLNCLRAASSCETGLDCAVVADDGGLLMEGSGGLELFTIGTEGEVPWVSSVLSLHSALSSSSTEDRLLVSSSFLSTSFFSSLSHSLSAPFSGASVFFFFLDLNEIRSKSFWNIFFSLDSFSITLASAVSSVSTFLSGLVLSLISFSFSVILSKSFSCCLFSFSFLVFFDLLESRSFTLTNILASCFGLFLSSKYFSFFSSSSSSFFFFSSFF